MEGKVETITGYGAFIDLGNGISGLVHISQISQKRIQSVHEVLKEGDDVKVKVIAVKDGKLSLSMKALQENTEVTQSAKEETFHYKEEGKATTGLGSILAGLKPDCNHGSVFAPYKNSAQPPVHLTVTRCFYIMASDGASKRPVNRSP